MVAGGKGNEMSRTLTVADRAGFANAACAPVPESQAAAAVSRIAGCI